MNSGWQTFIDFPSLKIKDAFINECSTFYIRANPDRKLTYADHPPYFSLAFYNGNLMSYLNNTNFSYVFDLISIEYTKTTD